MKNYVKIEPLYSILSSKPIDFGSMQVFDMQGIIVKQDKQIRALTEHIIDSSRLSMEIHRSDTSIIFYNRQIARIEVIDGNVRVVFEDDSMGVKKTRTIFGAVAKSIDGTEKYRTEIEDNVVTVYLTGNTDIFSLEII